MYPTSLNSIPSTWRWEWVALVAELDLNGKERVLHAHARADAREDLETNDARGFCRRGERVQQARADGEEDGRGDEEGPAKDELVWGARSRGGRRTSSQRGRPFGPSR